MSDWYHLGKLPRPKTRCGGCWGGTREEAPKQRENQNWILYDNRSDQWLDDDQVLSHPLIIISLKSRTFNSTGGRIY